MSRPEKIIDWEVVTKKLQAGCSGVEIAAFYGIHPDTLYKKTQEAFQMGFSDFSQQKKASGDSLLKEAQFNKAIEGDNSMLIWLGKNRLKQSDSPQDFSIHPETLKQFESIMNQLSSLQSDRKMADMSINTDNKS